MFTSEVASQLGCYVYRLVDPRDGQTFYVGKGTGNRVFSHARGAITSIDEGTLAPKLKVIADIIGAGLKVQHYVHRHGLDEPTAFHVEAALIDAYPALTNAVRGHRSDELGAMRTEDLMVRLQAPEARWQHDMLIVAINRTGSERDTYQAARYAWKLQGRWLPRINYVLAVRDGLIVDVFEPRKWLRGTATNFPDMSPEMPDRYGFEGARAPDVIWSLYGNKRVPADCKLSQSGLRYVGPATSGLPFSASA